MDPDSILGKLESLALCVRRIESKRPVDLESLECAYIPLLTKYIFH